MRAESPQTARLLGFVLPDLVAGRTDASTVQASVREFVKKKQELERKGANFAHLKSLAKAYPNFARWFDQVVRCERLEPDACSELVRAIALGEVRRNLKDRAQGYYENDVLEGKERKIDGGEYSLLLREAWAFFSTEETVASEVLLACRGVVGQESWQPPVLVDDQMAAARLADAEKKRSDAEARADQQRRLRIEAERARAEEDRRMQEATLRLEKELRQKAEEERRRAEEDRAAREAEASAAREHAAAVTAAADDAAAERAQERLRAERERELFHRANEAARRQLTAVLTIAFAALTGGLLGLAGARIGGVAGTGSSTSAAVSRHALLATTPSERLRRVCGVGNDTEAARGRLRAELDVAVKSVPSPEDRSRLAEKGALACGAPRTPTSSEQGR